MEGSTLTHDDTVTIWERGYFDGQARVDDLIETTNHFSLFDLMLRTFDEPLSPELLCRYQGMPKRGTSDERKPARVVGGFKNVSDFIQGTVDVETTAPADVEAEVGALTAWYEALPSVGLDEVLDFHVRLERIHPFSDGNGRVGRIVMFKECLRHDVLPFILPDEYKPFYIRGLRNWSSERGWLRDTCQLAQDYFRLAQLPLLEEYYRVLAKAAAEALP